MGPIQIVSRLLARQARLAPSPLLGTSRVETSSHSCPTTAASTREILPLAEMHTIQWPIPLAHGKFPWREAKPDPRSMEGCGTSATALRLTAQPALLRLTSQLVLVLSLFTGHCPTRTSHNLPHAVLPMDLFVFAFCGPQDQRCIAGQALQ